MNARAEIAGRGGGPAARLAGAFVLLVLGAATLVFWIGIPLGGLWLLARVTDSWNGHFLLSLVLIPVGMTLFSPALYWLNGLYLRVTGAPQPDPEQQGPRHRLQGPLEMFLSAGMAVAVAALLVWFFLFASNPQVTL